MKWSLTVKGAPNHSDIHGYTGVFKYILKFMQQKVWQEQSVIRTSDIFENFLIFASSVITMMESGG